MTFEPLASDFYAYESLLTDPREGGAREPARLARGRGQADRRRLLGPRRVPDAGREAASPSSAPSRTRGTRRGRSRTRRCSAASSRSSSPASTRRVATFVGVQNGLATGSISVCGSHEQRDEWIPKLASGEVLGAFGLTEPLSGSDSAQGLRTTAKRDGDYVGAQRRQALDRQRHVLGHHDHLGEGRRGRPGQGLHRADRRRPATRRRRSSARSACAPCRTPTSRSTTSSCPSRSACRTRTRSATRRACCASPAPRWPGPRSAPRSAPTRRP